VLACAGVSGCKSPWGWWGGDGGMYGSSAPDVGQQRYEGLSQDFSGGAASAYKTPAANENYFTSAWKKSTAAVGSAFSWQSKPAVTEDPTSLDSKTKPVMPDVYIAAGRMYETQGKYPEALQQYEKALKAAPGDLASLVSIARLHDRQENFPKAIEAYQRAAKAHPKSGLVQNDLGLCYARQKDAENSIAALTRACEFSPKNLKYRNNLATVLVENGRTEDAFRQLKALNSEGEAHYNLAYMLTSRGKQQEAAEHLRMALHADPELVPARQLLAQISGVPVEQFAAAPPPQQQPAPPFTVQPPMDERQQALSMFQGNTPPRNPTLPTGPSPFQQASQSSQGPVEIVFPTAPANAQQPIVQPPVSPPTAPQAAPAPALNAPAPTEDGSYRIGDDETPQLLPPVSE
jgi:tetratricopeptide (TPR) repeat protein